jgi:LysR family transcriptional regulator, transcriptional activator of nhaA
MTSLNYRHLHYFWVVAKEGGFARAAERLDMAVQTVSAQVKALEESLGHQLLKPQGRGLTLTEAGEAAFARAEEIFRIGQGLPTAVREAANPASARLAVGLSDGISKLAAHALLRPGAVHAEPAPGVPRRRVRAAAVRARAAPPRPRAGGPAGAPQPQPAAEQRAAGVFGRGLVRPERAGAQGRARGRPLATTSRPAGDAGAAAHGHSVVRSALDRWFEDQGLRPASRASSRTAR